jgi:hypothetical protein
MVTVTLPAERVIEMALLRCADVTLQHGYRYFVVTGVSDVSRTSSFTTPGYANTYGSAVAFGNYATGSATTYVTPPQTFRFYKPGIQVAIQMANDQKQLETNALVLNGRKATPQDATFLTQSLRQHLGIRSNQ